MQVSRKVVLWYLIKSSNYNQFKIFQSPAIAVLDILNTGILQNIGIIIIDEDQNQLILVSFKYCIFVITCKKNVLLIYFLSIDSSNI